MPKILGRKPSEIHCTSPLVETLPPNGVCTTMRSEPITPSTSRYQMSPKLPSSHFTVSLLMSILSMRSKFSLEHFSSNLEEDFDLNAFRQAKDVHLPPPGSPPGPLHCCISREYTSGGSHWSLRCGPSSTHAHTSRAPASAVGKVPVGATRGALPIQFVLTPVFLEPKTTFFEHSIG